MTFRESRIAALVLLLVAPMVMGSVGLRSNLDARVLAAHNRERNASGIPSLRWDASLAASAAEWAETLAATDRFEHSADQPGEEPQGENLWAGTPHYFHPEDMVGFWIAEKKYFKPGPFPDNSRTGSIADVGHYTQLMWHNTHRVGCALKAGKKEEVLVCRYSGPGNIIGEVPF